MPIAIRRLQLTDFRSYQGLDLRLAPGTIVLAGDNGAGKTNILEALSLLTPGRGLRRSDAAACVRRGGGGGWAVAAEIETADGVVQLGTGLDAGASALAPAARRYRLDREPVPSARNFAAHLSVVWLVPAMDGLFYGPAGERRRFLDRLVLSVDADHGARVAAFERALRNRNRLLEEGGDPRWLDAAEREAAALAVAVAAARVDLVGRLQPVLAPTDAAAAFPWAEVRLEGAVEDLVGTCSALDAEDHVRRKLREGRSRDAAAGRTLYGPQTSDLLVRHGPTATEAARASTGEQKALLVGLTLAHARLLAALSGVGALLLLDEVAAHFDRRRRSALFEVVLTLPAQVWMTGAERDLFAELDGRAQFVAVRPGHAALEAPAA